MRKNLGIAAAVVSFAASASAQEANWDRWFIGFDAGYISRSETTASDGKIDQSGAFAGASAGRWWTMDRISVGVESSLGVGGPSFDASQVYPGWGWNYSVAELVSVSAKLKAGVPMGRFMPYASAGFQYVHSFGKIFWVGTSNPDTASSTRFGATFSLGGEAMITPQISVRAEYGLNWLFPVSSQTFEYYGHGGKIGLNYYFD